MFTRSLLSLLAMIVPFAFDQGDGFCQSTAISLQNFIGVDITHTLFWY